MPSFEFLRLAAFTKCFTLVKDTARARLCAQLPRLSPGESSVLHSVSHYDVVPLCRLCKRLRTRSLWRLMKITTASYSSLHIVLYILNINISAIITSTRIIAWYCGASKIQSINILIWHRGKESNLSVQIQSLPSCH
jgi:hypothetical protein